MTFKDNANHVNPNQVSDMLRALKFGDVLRALPVRLFGKAPSLPLNEIAAVWTLALPDDAKAASVLRAYARAGSGTLGELTVDGVMGGATAAGHIGVTQSGDLSFAAADAWTDVDVLYVPRYEDVVTLPLVVVPGTGVAVLPAWMTTRKVQSLLRATVTAGGVVGPAAVIAPTIAGTPPGATHQVNLSTNKAQVQFPKLRRTNW